MKPDKRREFRVSIKIDRDLWSVPLLARYCGQAAAFKILTPSPVWHGAEVRRQDVHLFRKKAKA